MPGVMRMEDPFSRFLASGDGRAALAGAAGGLVRWLVMKTHWQDGLVAVLVGGICAVYLNPLAKPLVDAAFGHFVVESASRAGFSGFILGLGGIGITGFVMDVIRSTLRQKQNEAKRGPDAGS